MGEFSTFHTPGVQMAVVGASLCRRRTDARSKREGTTMQYLLMIYSEEGAWSRMTEAQQKEGMAAFMAYTDALRKAGALVNSNRLRDVSSASTVRVVSGKTQVTDGPFADTKEQLGGYYLIEAKDLDAAISWAAKCPGAAYGKIEVRPIWSM